MVIVHTLVGNPQFNRVHGLVRGYPPYPRRLAPLGKAPKCPTSCPNFATWPLCVLSFPVHLCVCYFSRTHHTSSSNNNCNVRHTLTEEGFWSYGEYGHKKRLKSHASNLGDIPSTSVITGRGVEVNMQEWTFSMNGRMLLLNELFSMRLHFQFSLWTQRVWETRPLTLALTTFHNYSTIPPPTQSTVRTLPHICEVMHFYLLYHEQPTWLNINCNDIVLHIKFARQSLNETASSIMTCPNCIFWVNFILLIIGNFNSFHQIQSLSWIPSLFKLVDLFHYSNS